MNFNKHPRVDGFPIQYIYQGRFGFLTPTEGVIENLDPYKLVAYPP